MKTSAFYLNRMNAIEASHDSGASFAAIGSEYGISCSRARQIYVKAKRIRRHPEELEIYTKLLKSLYRE